jgi:hypothetical protein
MQEKQLKELFISSVKSGHVHDNTFLPEPKNTDGNEVVIKEECYFRSFDLVVASIKKKQSATTNFESNEEYDHFFNILVRTELLAQFAKTEKCRIDWIRFYPVELKSDEDILDERLPNQILDAVLTFGRSIIVLDENHSKNFRQRGILKLLPSTIIGYTGKEDYFKVLHVFDRFITNSIFDIPKRNLTKILRENNLLTKSDNFYHFVSIIQRINQKLVFSQVFSRNLSLIPEEKDFIENLPDHRILSDRKQIKHLIKLSANNKITDYL